MSEPEITQDVQDVEGHALGTKRDEQRNESDMRRAASEARDDRDDDVAGHGMDEIR